MMSEPLADMDWVTIERYDHQWEYAVPAARLAHEGIPYRVVPGELRGGKKTDQLLQVPRTKAEMAAHLLGLPRPEWEPVPQLTGLGLWLHRWLAPVLTAIQYRRGLDLRMEHWLIGSALILIVIWLLVV